MKSKALVDSSNKCVIITGCDSGFGYMLAIRLLEQGFTVYAGCLFPESEHLRLLVSKYGEKLQIVSMNVTDEKAVKEAYNYIRTHIYSREQKLQALVNNAGVIASNEVEWGPIETYTNILDINVIGLVRVTRQFLPLIREHRSRIINMGSVSSHFTAPTLTAYSMSKYAVTAFTNGLRREMEKWDIDVVLVEPDTYETPMTINNALIKSLEYSWKNSDCYVQQTYGNEYFEATKSYMRKHLRTARKNTNEVIDVLQLAVAAKSFNKHYICCGFHNRLIIWIFDFLPSQFIEPFVRLYTVQMRPQYKNS